MMIVAAVNSAKNCCCVHQSWSSALPL